jgi:rare lipoprotein A (peptidoglycan hydrolase)
MSYISEIRPQVAEHAQENASWYGECASGRRIYAYVQNDPLNLTDPSGLCAQSGCGNADPNYQVIGSGITSRIPGSYDEAAQLTGYATYYNLPGNTTASGQPFNPNGMNAAMTGNRAPIGANVQVQLQSDPSSSIQVQINDTGPFARNASGAPLQPLQPDPNSIIDLTPHAFDVLTNNNRALGRVPVVVTVPDHN